LDENTLVNGKELFPSFNAKTMSRAKIVDSFVPSKVYEPAVGNHHVLIVGPRGSGKTTLLKMLEVDSLRTWNHPLADDWRSSQTHNGVYVPSDLVWNTAIKGIREVKLDPEAADAFSLSIFATSVMLALCAGMKAKVTADDDFPYKAYRLHEAEPRAIQSALSKVAEKWRLPSQKVATFGELRNQLHERMIVLQQTVSLTDSSRKLTLADLHKALPFTSLPPFQLFESALDLFDEEIGDPSGTWALLLDEFELAPACVRKMILLMLRSTSKKLLFKITLAPYTPDMDFGVVIAENNDFKRVQLWYAKRNDLNRFSTDLFYSWTKSRFGAQSARLFPEHYLPEQQGNSYVDVTEASGNLSESESESRRKRICNEFRELAEKDQTFEQYLTRRLISISELETLPVVPNEIRKIAPTVFARNRKMRSDGHLTSKKSDVELYSGWNAISAICEGNPRWLFGLLSMIEKASSGSEQSAPVPVEAQSKAIKAFAETYVAMLSVLAQEQPLLGLKSDHHVFEILDTIGKAFERHLYKADFVPEPPLSFTVDLPNFEVVLRIALNHGAIVFADEGLGEITFSTLQGKRFRLSYLLATRYSLLLRIHRPLKLSELLGPTHKTTTTAPHPTQGLLSLEP
jgi:hypothetical protein